MTALCTNLRKQQIWHKDVHVANKGLSWNREFIFCLDRVGYLNLPWVLNLTIFFDLEYQSCNLLLKMTGPYLKLFEDFQGHSEHYQRCSENFRVLVPGCVWPSTTLSKILLSKLENLGEVHVPSFTCAFFSYMYIASSYTF